MPHYRAYVEIDGLASVYAVRAAWTALTALPGIVTASVSLDGAVLETEFPVDEQALADVLATAGVTPRSLRQESWTPQGL